MNTSIIDSLKKIVDENIISFHMPGHKKGYIYKRLGYEDLVKSLYTFDTTEIPGTDNLHCPEDCINQSLTRASKVFKSDKTFYLINGSTCGIEASIMALTKPGDKIILNRDCHQSAINACIIADLNPIYIKPKINKANNSLVGVSVEDVKSTIDANLDCKVIFLTYPTYFGDTFDLKNICDYAHKKDMTVIIDEAHGAHLGLSKYLPNTALSQGADIVIQSTHKTLPAFTQSSMIHVKGNRVDLNKLANMLRITESSSPSYVLMASLDLAVDIYEKYGFDLMDELIINIEEFTDKIKHLKNIKVDIAKDKTKIFLNTEKLGITGHSLEKILREEYSIQVELSNYYGVLLITTIGNTKEDFNCLKNALYEIDNKYYEQEKRLKEIFYPNKIPKKILTPRQAFYMDKKNVKIEDSIGKISGEYIIPYPPGVSLVSPGEEITSDVIDYILKGKDNGMSINGVKDSELKFIQIIDID